MAGLKTRGVYQKAVKNQGSALEECTHRSAYFWLHHEGNRLKSAWGSSQDHPSMHSAHTGILLQPLVLGHCSPLKGSLLLSTRVCTLGGNRASPDHDPAPEQGRGSRHQLIPSCTQSEGSKSSFPVGPPSQAHMCLCIPGDRASLVVSHLPLQPLPIL